MNLGKEVVIRRRSYFKKGERDSLFGEVTRGGLLEATGEEHPSRGHSKGRDSVWE